MIKPARYTGGEWNSVVKDWDEIDIKIALAYPDVYEVGMSNLAIMILYHLLNKQEGVLAERVYAPGVHIDRPSAPLRSDSPAVYPSGRLRGGTCSHSN